MSYYSIKKSIKETVENKTIAVATYERGAEIIATALNFYFSDNYTRNESVEMMHTYSSKTLNTIADFVEKNNYSKEEIIDYLRELQDEMEAQAIVVSMRDELKFDKPNPDEPKS